MKRNMNWRHKRYFSTCQILSVNEQTFFGCVHRRKVDKFYGRKFVTIEYDMSSFVQRSIEKYQNAVYETTGRLAIPS